MRRILHVTLASLFVCAGALATIRLHAQQHAEHQKEAADCPMMRKHGAAATDERGDEGMGFSQEKTTHHFYLTKTGGVIEVEADDAKDTASRDQIRRHLGHIAVMFSEGDFDIPMFVHDQVPPGVPLMRSLKAAIGYKFEETKQGGRVRITSDDPRAVAAIQSFLRFQITEHKTGDPLEVGR